MNTKTQEMIEQISAEFPYLSPQFVDALRSVAEKKMVVPSLELDREIHAVCLVSHIYLRLNSIMCDAVGFGFVHRPACDIGDGDNLQVTMPKLSKADAEIAEKHYRQVLPEMIKLEGIDSPIVDRRAPIGTHSIN